MGSIYIAVLPLESKPIILSAAFERRKMFFSCTRQRRVGSFMLKKAAWPRAISKQKLTNSILIQRTRIF